MCGRFACSLHPEDIQKSCAFIDKNGKLSKPKWVEDTGCVYKSFYNGPPTTTVAVLVNEACFDKNVKETSSYCLAPMRWGFKPVYQLDSQTLLHTHNARIETVTKSHMYKPSLSGKRCIVVADGFFEWQTAKGVGKGQPYFIYQDPFESEAEKQNSKYLMKLAGLYTSCYVDNNILYSCTVLTTDADESLSWLHHRMPVILNSQSEIEDWLNCNSTDYSTILNTVSQSFDKRSDSSHKLKYYTVDKKYVNSTSCNDAKCVARMSVKRPNTLDGWLKSNKKK